jgi:endonuclease/exonuclease/phosphatase family metal-dependent hydrolase
MIAGPRQFSVGTFNLHAGVDGWGRPFDVVAACRAVDTDVLVLQECWSPETGPGDAQRIGSALGYTVLEHPLAHGRRGRADPRADHRWVRPMAWYGTGHALYLDSERRLPSSITTARRYREAELGTLGLAILSRLPVRHHKLIDLGRLGRDRVRRAALVVRVGIDDRDATVVGTHMAHLTYGAPLHYRALGRALAAGLGDGPAVLAGDMNLWGPPVRALLPGWHRAVKGRTWPAWRPHSQIDHILVRGPLNVVSGAVLGAAGSDHRPVRAILGVP